MRMGTIVIGVAILIVLALAVAVHLFGPELARSIHGGR